MLSVGKLTLSLCCSLLWAAFASAATLNVGSGVYNPIEGDPVGGTIIATLSQPFSAPGKYTGTLISNVIAGDLSNPYGGLTFTYTLINDATSKSPLTALTINGFEGALTDASYKSPGRAPTNVDRLTDGVVGFRFVAPIFLPAYGTYGNGVLQPGLTSSLLVVQTDRGGYTTASAQVINGAVTSTFALVPTVVPEPSSLALAAIGVGLAFCSMRRRR